MTYIQAIESTSKRKIQNILKQRFSDFRTSSRVKKKHKSVKTSNFPVSKIRFNRKDHDFRLVILEMAGKVP